MKIRTGTLVKRGRCYYCRYVVAGKVKVERLLDAQGHSITDKDQAESARLRMMSPLRLADQKTTITALQIKLAGVDAEIAQDAARREAASALTFADAWEAYGRAGNRREISDGTLANYRGYWQLFTAWLGQEEDPPLTYMRELTFAHCERYKEYLLARHVTGRTFNAHRAFLRSFWNVLAEKARVEVNPWARLAKRDEYSKGRRALTVEELARVCRSATGELRMLLAMGLYLGARLGDCCMMEWGMVDLVRRMICYVPRKTARKIGRPLHVPLHADLFLLLAGVPARQRQGYVCPQMARLYAARGADGVSALVQEHFQKCGLTTQAERSGAGVRRVVTVGFHSLRHTAVSLLRGAGVAQSVSMAIAGHSEASVHALYTHSDETSLRRAVAVLPAISTRTALPVRSPVARLARLRRKVDKLPPARLKRAVQRLLALHKHGSG
jgi:integrase